MNLSSSPILMGNVANILQNQILTLNVEKLTSMLFGVANIANTLTSNLSNLPFANKLMPNTSFGQKLFANIPVTKIVNAITKDNTANDMGSLISTSKVRQRINETLRKTIQDFLDSLKPNGPPHKIGECFKKAAECDEFEKKIQSGMKNTIERHYKENRSIYQTNFVTDMENYFNAAQKTAPPPEISTQNPMKL